MVEAEIYELEIERDKYAEEAKEVMEKINDATNKVNFCKKKILEGQEESLNNANEGYRYATVTAEESYRSTTKIEVASNNIGYNPKAQEMESTWYEIDSIYTDLENQKQYINKTINLLEENLTYWKNRKKILDRLIIDLTKKIEHKRSTMQ